MPGNRENQGSGNYSSVNGVNAQQPSSSPWGRSLLPNANSAGLHPKSHGRRHPPMNRGPIGSRSCGRRPKCFGGERQASLYGSIPRPPPCQSCPGTPKVNVSSGIFMEKRGFAGSDVWVGQGQGPQSPPRKPLRVSPIAIFASGGANSALTNSKGAVKGKVRTLTAEVNDRAASFI